MGAIWLTNMADVLRAGGVKVSEEPGWKTRSRSSGGYDQVLGIGVHHDAAPAGTPEQNRTNYEVYNASARPIGALHLRQDGTWHVQAAGATNTQGRGGPFSFSKGTCPQDQGNRFILSIEASNSGTGQAWPTIQQKSYVHGCAVLCDWLGLKPSDCIAHFEWTNRKVDPAGNSRYATGSNKWGMNTFRSDIANVLQTIQAPPDEGDDDMTDAQLKAITDRLDKIAASAKLVEIRSDYLVNKWAQEMLTLARTDGVRMNSLTNNTVPQIAKDQKRVADVLDPSAD